MMLKLFILVLNNILVFAYLILNFVQKSGLTVTRLFNAVAFFLHFFLDYVEPKNLLSIM